MKKYKKKENAAEVENSGICRTAALPYWYLIAGIPGAIIFAVFTVIMISSENRTAGVICGSIGFLFLILVIIWITCRICYTDSRITIRNLWGRSKTYSYSDITGISELAYTDHLYFGVDRLRLSHFSKSHMDFRENARKRYKQIKRKNIPDLTKYRSGLFCGNIKNPGRFIFIDVIIYIVLIGVVISSIDYFHDDLEYETKEVVIIEYDEWEDWDGDREIDLILNNGESYKVSYVPESLSLDELRSVCDKKTEVTVCGHFYNSEKNDGTKYMDVRAISQGDKIILSEDDTFKMVQANNRDILLVWGILGAVWTLIVVLSIITGRNSEKYPKLVRLFFKEENIR